MNETGPERKKIKEIKLELRRANKDNVINKHITSGDAILLLKSLYGEKLFDKLYVVSDFIYNKSDISAEEYHWLMRCSQYTGIDPSTKWQKDNDFIYSYDKIRINSVLGLQEQYSKIQSICKSNVSLPINTNKIAICITGQMRGFDKVIESLNTYLLDKSPYQYDVYVSTWDNIGYRVHRLFPKEVLNVIPRKYGFGHDFIEKNLPRINEALERELTENSYDYISKNFNKLNNLINFNIYSEKEFDKTFKRNYLETTDLNQYKLFYLMSLAAKDILEVEKKNEERYAKIIKLRPDKLLNEQFDFNVVTNERELAVNNLDFFGVGDQTLYGHRDAMIQALLFWDFYYKQYDDFKKLTNDSVIVPHRSYTKYLWSLGCTFKLLGDECNGKLINFELDKNWFFENGILSDLDELLLPAEKRRILRQDYLTNIRIIADKVMGTQPDLAKQLLELFLIERPNSKHVQKMVDDLNEKINS